MARSTLRRATARVGDALARDARRAGHGAGTRADADIVAPPVAVAFASPRESAPQRGFVPNGMRAARQVSPNQFDFAGAAAEPRPRKGRGYDMAR